MALFSAASLCSAERIGTQYFDGYQDQFHNGKWGIIDDLDYRQLKETLPAKEAKALYVDEGHIQFDAQWTRQTLKRMYPLMWEDAMSVTGKERHERIQTIRDLACDAKLEVGYAKTYGIKGEGFVTELDTDLNAPNMEGCAKTTGGEAAAVRLRTFIPTVPGASYKLHVKYQKRDYKYSSKGINENKAYKDLMVRVGSDRHTLSLEEEEPVKLQHLTVDLPNLPANSPTHVFDSQALDEDGDAWVRYSNNGDDSVSLYFESGSGQRLTEDLSLPGETATYFNLGQLDPAEPIYAILNSNEQRLIDFGFHALELANRFEAPYNIQLEEGFKKSVIPFVADRFYTKIVLNDKSYADSFGVLVSGLHIDEVEGNPRETECRVLFPSNSKKLRQCLLGDIANPVANACDLSSGKIAWTEGKNTSSQQYRSDIQNLFYNQDDKVFLSLGQSGRVKVTPTLGDTPASCPVLNKSLTFSEITWGNKTYETYSEKGQVKIKLQGCVDESLNGSQLLTNDRTSSSRLKTHDSFSFFFDQAYEGCLLKSISIIDKTHKIKPSQPSYVRKSDGLDINSLALTLYSD